VISYDEIKAEMKTIQQQIAEAKSVVLLRQLGML